MDGERERENTRRIYSDMSFLYGIFIKNRKRVFRDINAISRVDLNLKIIPKIWPLFCSVAAPVWITLSSETRHISVIFFFFLLFVPPPTTPILSLYYTMLYLLYNYVQLRLPERGCSRIIICIIRPTTIYMNYYSLYFMAYRCEIFVLYFPSFSSQVSSNRWVIIGTCTLTARITYTVRITCLRTCLKSDF